MLKLPNGWQVYERSDPDGTVPRSRLLVTHHKNAEAWRGWFVHRRLALQKIALWGLIAISLGLLSWRMLSHEPLPPPPHPSTWSAEMRAKHQIARPSCDAARAAGLAPARKGYPGYWPHLDADNDGMSCEWFFDISSISLRTLIGGK
ncbi:excalibur calcium-binding domain-containing protein [Microvirga sp. BT689]|uniref:excalibur calcium-binding domain-containing protein n=1 Tax=Microvirga arvi TaxID=2778731 RepID=UPI00194EB979|nr:excalibur calcium-binding domain-containing protein [Microvirga arvi]MBM6579218.1 excalibur calcium-binding domain-containing protein [Microvirga arvi]